MIEVALEFKLSGQDQRTDIEVQEGRGDKGQQGRSQLQLKVAGRIVEVVIEEEEARGIE